MTYWKPGVPLYLHPDNRDHGEEPRPIFQVFDDHECPCEDACRWVGSGDAARWTPSQGWW